MAYQDPDTEIRKAEIAAASHEKVAGTQAEGQLAAARVSAAGHVESAGVTRAGLEKMQQEKIAQEVMDTRTKGLGDPGSSWGGQGPINLAAVRKGAGVVPAGTGAETGTREQLGGGIEVMGEGTFNRPAHREVVGAEGGGPVQVIRRMKSTFAGGAPGEEFQDLGAARQAINRAAGVGEYVSPEEARYIAEVEKNPLNKMKAEAGYTALAKDALRNKMIGEFGVPDPADPTKTILTPEMEKLFAKHSSGLKHPDGVTAAWEKIAPEGETYKTLHQLKDPTSRKGMVKQAQDYFAKLPPEKRPLTPSGEPMTDEAFRAYTDRMPLDPESVGWMMKYGGLASSGAAKITKPAAAGGGVPLPPGFTPAVAPAAATPRQPIIAAETPLSDFAPAGAAAPGAAAPVVDPQLAETSRRLREVTQKPIWERGPEDIAFLHSLGPDYNLGANVGLHQFRQFFRVTPKDEAGVQQGNAEVTNRLRKLYEPGATR